MKHSQSLKLVLILFSLFVIFGCATKKATVQAPMPDTLKTGSKISTIQKIAYTEEENYTRVQVEGSEPIAPPFYKLLTDPLRIVIDVPNIDLKQVRSPIEINNGTIGEVLTTQYDDKGRIEISLMQVTNYNISEGDKYLVIDIEKVKMVAKAPEPDKKELIEKHETPEKTEPIEKEEPIIETKVEASTPETSKPIEETKPIETVKKEEPLPASPPQKEEPLPAVPPQMGKAKEVVNIQIEEKPDLVAFNIIADGRIENYNSFKLDSPARLVLDIWEVGSRYPRKLIKMDNPIVKAVRLGKYPDKLRVVFDSSKPNLPNYQINREDGRLLVLVGEMQEKSVKEAPVPSSKPQIEKPEKSHKQNRLTGIDFKQINDKSRIVLSLSSEDSEFESSMPSKNLITIKVKNAMAPKNLLRGLDTSAFESAIHYIDLKNIKEGKTNNILVSVKLREETSYETTKEGKEIFIDIKERPKKAEVREPTILPEVKKEEVTPEVVKKEIKEIEVKEEPKEEPKKEEAIKEAPPAEEIKKVEVEKKISEEEPVERKYSGRKLSLDFKDADIKNILRLIAEVSNLNIIAGDDVTGKVTMRLVDVPWDQALEIILQSRNLGMTRVGNVIRIAPNETLKKEVQAELEAKRAKEKLEDLELELVPVNYASAKEILSQVKSVLSDRGDVKIDERTNILIVKDIPRNIAAVKDLVKALDRKTPQVLIEARIVEANLTFQRELGVKWGFLVGGGKATAGGGISGTSTLDSSKTTHGLVNLPAVPKVGTAGIFEFLFSRGTISELDIAISAHENQGDVKIISSPKIATLDNKEAYIEQGLRIPYIKYTAEGTATVDFIEANLKLTVTPHVTNDGHIKLSIKAKKDAPDSSITVLGTPSIDKKEAASEVLIKDNGVVAIAGVYSIEKTEGDEGIPLFKKIPLLGWLFKRENKEDKRKDLLIFISPKIIKDEV